MYIVQYTKHAHTKVPECCWLTGSRHRKLTRALLAERRYQKPAPIGAWSNNTRIIVEETGEVPDWRDEWAAARALGWD